MLIDVSIERELMRHLDPRARSRLCFERLAITPAQIATYDLPGNPRKTRDRRSLHIQEAVEAEAMPAAIMRALLREAIEALLPDNALAVARAAEQSEKQYLDKVARLLEGQP